MRTLYYNFWVDASLGDGIFENLLSPITLELQVVLVTTIRKEIIILSIDPNLL
jgi:hypothetical protein